MTEKLVSIVIPCYNYAHYLPETLNNIILLRYTNWECIMVNDGSKDNTEEVARSFLAKDARFRYVYQQNQGLSAARNTGIANSKGVYLQFLDADDMLDKDKIALQSKYLDEHPAVDVVYGNFSYFHTDDPGQKLKGRNKEEHAQDYLKGSGKGRDMLQRFSRDNFIPVSAPLVRRSIIDKTGLFDTSYTSYEDWQYWFRACLNDAAFDYAPIKGTETYIRFGHVSMMGNTSKMVANGVRLRKFMMPYLHGQLKLYNRYRLLKLQLRTLFKK
jgi:glycosyltransferase involved in cell wall biosynthesis